MSSSRKVRNLQATDDKQVDAEYRFRSITVGDIAACDSGDTAHRLSALVYEPGGQERATGSPAKAYHSL